MLIQIHPNLSWLYRFYGKRFGEVQFRDACEALFQVYLNFKWILGLRQDL